MKLSHIAELLGAEWRAENRNSEDVDIEAIAVDTRAIPAHALFVAYAGSCVDSHAYLEEALAKGARALLVADSSRLPANVPALVHKNPRRAISRLAAHFAGEPSQELLTIGVTGTNGKSTTHFLLHHALELLGSPGARLGTIGFVTSSGTAQASNLTTPGALELQNLLAQVKEQGLRHVIMEVASHGLEQERVEDVYFDIGIFTNLTPDHLDYHGNMEKYFLAKRKLFDLVRRSDVAKAQEKLQGTPAKPHPSFAIINVDSPSGRRYAEYCQSLGLSYFTYGFSEGSDLRIVQCEQDISGSHVRLDYQGEEFSLKSPLIGRFNAENIAAVLLCLLQLGYAISELLPIVPQLPHVPGRLESLSTKDIGIYVDYAHTPDALEKSLNALRDLAPKRLWVLFGCGGDRDPGRRFGMGEVAGRLADKVVVTSDNPRTEDPQKIIGDILSTGLRADIVEADRRKAIFASLDAAEAGDIVLIAGKGHEDYQIIGHERYPFLDADEVRAWKESRQKGDV